MLRWLLRLIRGERRSAGKDLPKRERVGIILRRLSDARPVANAEQALELIHRIVDEVEDEHSGMAKIQRPPLDSERMYGPFADRITRHHDGSMKAQTAAHRIHIGRGGSIRIEQKNGRVVLEKPGASGEFDDH